MAQELVNQATVAIPPAAPSAEEPKPVLQDVQIHPAGELYIITSTKRFQVLSAALRLSSPVFSCMLSPTSPFYEGQLLASSTKDSPASVTLKEDDPEALEVILNIAHFNGHSVPMTLESKKLFQVASLCDKYDMAKALRGFSMLWTVKLTVDNIKGRCAIRWLAAAWATKNEVLFEIVTAYLVKYVKYRPSIFLNKPHGEEKGTGAILVFHDGANLDTDGIPQKVLGMSNELPHSI